MKKINGKINRLLNTFNGPFFSRKIFSLYLSYIKSSYKWKTNNHKIHPKEEEEGLENTNLIKLKKSQKLKKDKMNIKRFKILIKNKKMIRPKNNK